MYSRIIDGSEYTFGVSGKLIMNVLVMYDHQTRTLWSQFLGRGVQGELAGVDLEILPVTQTTWDSWKALHPDTVVLDKRGRYRIDSYRGYYGSDQTGVLGEFHRDDRLDPKDLIVGVDFGGLKKAYPFSILDDQPVLNDSVDDRDALIYFDHPSGTALVYDRTIDGRSLTFRLDGSPAGIQTTLVDDETGSRWLAFTGVALDGPLKGRQLERVPSHLSFWFAWTDWNPDTQLFGG